MKILGVRFKNLNSLAGEWEVDFTDSEYVADGIFAITGPTGAGKTTILDAICLGLYGRTPRLDKVTKTSNEIMSRQTGACFAEVTFQTRKGRFRCHWSQHRARKKPGGELQPARHEIADARCGTVLESKLSRVGKFVETATGMDFGRFTRSMMLAQGEFAAFLAATPDERAPILEQITGTEIYSRISIQVHERRKEEQGKRDVLQAELNGIEILGEEEAAALKADLEEKRPREEELEVKIKGLRKAEQWRRRVMDLEKECLDLDGLLRDIDQRRQAFEPDSKKLEKARKALDLEGGYQAVSGLRTLQQAETAECHGAIARLPEKEKKLADRLALKNNAEKGLAGARAVQQAQARVIKEVRELDTRLRGQEKQLGEKKRSIKDGDAQAKAYDRDLQTTRRMLETSKQALDTANAYLARHAPDAALITDLAAIEKGFSQVRAFGAKHAGVRQTLAGAVEKKALALKERNEIEDAHGKASQAFEKGDGECKQLAQEIESALKGRDIGRLRNEADALKERRRLMLQTLEALERIEKGGTALARMKGDLEKMHADGERLSGEAKLAGEQRAVLEKEIETLDTEVSLRSRIRDLEKERKRLGDGMPCPLCGATDHPFASGNVPELDKAETERNGKRAELKQVAKALNQLEAEKIKTMADIRHTQKVMAEKRDALNKDETAAHDVLAGLNIHASSDNRAVTVRQEIENARVKIAELSGIVARVEENGKKEASAQKRLEKLRGKRDDLYNRLKDARHKLENAGLEHDRLAKDCDIASAETETARIAALNDLKPYGIYQLSLSGLDAVSSVLAQRKRAFEATLDERGVHEKKIGDLKAEIQKTGALLDRLEKDMAERRMAGDDLARQCSSLGKTRKALFGEKETDQEEKQLKEAVDQAEETFEKARAAHGRIENEVRALKEKIDFLKEKTEKRAKELARAENKLNHRIKKAGFKDEAEFLSARMSEEAREQLAEKEASLGKAQTALDARKKEKVGALAVEREKRLTHQSMDVLRENIGICDADLKQIRTDIGGIEKSLGENEKMRAKQQERLERIAAQKTECLRWDNLHQLIGSADGKKFRNFAQGLTFEVMVVHANRQLGKMTDRYLLVRDPAQPLELNVMDNYQAGQIRSTKNLSGGESFIVSLALALGLSQMASRNVRVDSLFLDEGFGTLDDDALETALETLSGLQQDGKLIGVISHVPALKERIGTQIQVTAGTGGRSRITGPGCRQC